MLGGLELLGSLLPGMVSAGGSLLGGHWDREQAKDINTRSEWWARHGIKARIQDAREAGIHPLYALGAQTSSPQFMMSGMAEPMARAGQAIGSSIERAMDSDSRIHMKLSNMLLEKQVAKTEAERRMIEQEALALQQRRGQGGGLPLFDPGPNGIPGQQGQQDSGLFEAVPGKRSTSVPGMPEIQAGPDQSYKKHYLAGGLPIYLPYSDEGPAETQESIPFWQWPGLIAMNRNVFGDQWLSDWSNLTVRGRIPARQKWQENWSPGSRERWRGPWKEDRVPQNKRR